MISSLRISATAEIDILLATNWYDSQSFGLGDAFIEELERIYRQSLDYPEMHQLVEANVRRAVVYRFPYAVIYRVLPGTIEVIGVLPDRADPQQLVNRAATSGSTK
jgi:plasmid stabilization system protein ParE